MKKFILAAAILVMCGTQVFAKKSYDEKYREQMLKHIEVSGMNEMMNHVVDYALENYGGSRVTQKEKAIIDILRKEIPNVAVLVLEPAYKQNLTLKQLKRSNRVMGRRAVQTLKGAQPAIMIHTIDNIKEISTAVEAYIKEKAIKAYLDENMDELFDGRDKSYNDDEIFTE